MKSNLVILILSLIVIFLWFQPPEIETIIQEKVVETPAPSILMCKGSDCYELKDIKGKTEYCFNKDCIEIYPNK